MSTYYSVYAEANIDGKWYSLCPYFRNNKGETKTNAIFWAQSVFWEVNNYLEDSMIGRGIPEDMSDGLREIFHEDLQEEMKNWGHPITWGKYYESCIYYVNFDKAVVPKVNKDKPYKYEGFVLKKELAEFEVYEREEFSEWLTQDEYNALTDKQKRQYIFHRWNDPYGEYWIYRIIADRVWTLASLFADACESDIGGSLYQGISDSQIRLYVHRS